VAACEAATGVELWRREVVDAGAPRIGDDAAIEATAAVSVDGAVLLVACYDGSLVALCAETGAELWRCRAEAEIKGAPLVYAPPSEASLPSALATQAPPPRPSLSSSSSSSSSLNFPGPSSSTRGFAPSVYTGCAFFGAHDAAVRCVFVSPEGSSGSTTSTNSSSNNSSSGAPLLSPEADASRTPGAVWWRFDVDGAVYASLALARAESWEHPRRAKGGGKGGIGSSGHGGGRQGTAAQFIVTGTGTDAAPGTVAELLLTATTKGTLYAHFLGTLEILASNGAGDEESSSSSRDGNNGGGGAPAAPTMAWRYAAGAPLFATPAVHTPLNLAVCATVGGRVVGVSLRDGSPRWVCLAGRAVFSSPALSRASPARASSASGAEDEEAEAEARVVVGCHDGTLSCRTVASGRRVWTTHLAEACRAGPLLLPKLPKLFELPGLRNPSVPTAERAEAGSSSGGSSHSDNNNNGSSSAAAAAPASDGAYAEPAVPPEVPAEDPIFAAPFVFSEGSFSGGGGCGRGKSLVCAASQSGLVAVLDLATGEALAALRLPGQIFSSPVVLAAAAAGDASARTHHIILIGCRDDHLYALDFLA
jgi:outer membrane protein assembly factor BamB